MPDRDYISRQVRAPWRAAARLWVSDGPTDLMIDKARAALAKALREGGVAVERARLEAGQSGGHLDPEALEHLVERLLIQRSLFAPTRVVRLQAVDVARLDRHEQQVLSALAPDLERNAVAVLAGRRPRVRRRPRPDVRRVLETTVPIQLP